jgi:hypothetical protein
VLPSTAPVRKRLGQSARAVQEQRQRVVRGVGGTHVGQGVGGGQQRGHFAVHRQRQGAGGAAHLRLDRAAMRCHGLHQGGGAQQQRRQQHRQDQQHEMGAQAERPTPLQTGWPRCWRRGGKAWFRGQAPMHDAAYSRLMAVP